MLVYSAHRDPGLSLRRLRHLPDEPSAHENISWLGAQILFYVARWCALQCKCRRVLAWLIDWLIDHWRLSKFRFPLWHSVKRVYVCRVDSKKKWSATASTFHVTNYGGNDDRSRHSNWAISPPFNICLQEFLPRKKCRRLSSTFEEI